jgi:broad specificity phosphatase PhoE
LLDVEAEEPDSIKTWLSDVNAAPHGGESIARVLQRIATWLDLRIGDDGHGIAVTHAAVVRGAILHAVGAPAQSFWHIDVGPLSVPELRNDGFRWRWRDQRRQFTIGMILDRSVPLQPSYSQRWGLKVVDVA